MTFWLTLIVVLFLTLAIDLYLGRNLYLGAPRTLAKERAMRAGLNPYKVPEDGFLPGLISPVILYREFVDSDIIEGDRRKRTGWKVAFAW